MRFVTILALLLLSACDGMPATVDAGQLDDAATVEVDAGPPDAVCEGGRLGSDGMTWFDMHPACPGGYLPGCIIESGSRAGEWAGPKDFDGTYLYYTDPTCPSSLMPGDVAACDSGQHSACRAL